VTIRVTIRADALPGLTQLVKEAAGQPGAPAGNGEPDGARSHVLGAPGRIRTCAHGSGGHIHVQRRPALTHLDGGPRGASGAGKSLRGRGPAPA
jgi:hypothetical protein